MPSGHPFTRPRSATATATTSTRAEPSPHTVVPPPVALPPPFGSTRRRSCRRTVLAAALALAAAIGPGVAAAQTTPSAQDIALAEKAFDEGIALAQAGNCRDAIVKLELSHRIDPAAGTALNLGKCYEMLGRTASAYGAYSQSAGLARVKVNDQIRTEAEERMKAVAPSLSSIEFHLAGQSPAPSTLSVTVDGNSITGAALGVALPADPGTHTIEASAPGKRPWKTSIAVPAGPATTTVEIPALQDAPSAPPAAGGMSTGALAATIGLAGAGAVALGIGVGFGLDSLDRNAASKKLCLPADETQCSAAGVDLRNQAFSSATASNVAFGAGAAALLAAGGVLIVSRVLARRPAPGQGTAMTGVAVGPGGIMIHGRW